MQAYVIYGLKLLPCIRFLLYAKKSERTYRGLSVAEPHLGLCHALFPQGKDCAVTCPVHVYQTGYYQA